jgi:3-oxoacyl-[acyl-carrier protein] reductase
MDTIFHPKTAYVSGASRGIGKAIATALAKEGYNLSLSCRKNTDKLLSLKEDLEREYHVRVLTFTGDVGDYDFMEKVVKETLSVFHSIDVVINNAGIANINLLTDLTLDEWNTLLKTNLTSVFLSSKLFVPHMISKKSGNIINISSMWGTVGASMEVAYSATKGGVNSFTKALSKELAPSNISVNAISCGVIDTEMNHCFSDEELEALTEEIPAGRMASPKEVGETVIAIINSPNYLTGQIIGLDGGYI